MSLWLIKAAEVS